MDDVTALYMRHAAASNDSVAENAKTIILDVVGYFFQRAQLDRNSLENSNHQMDGAENNSGHDGNSNDENVNSSCRDVNIDVNRDNVVLVDHEVRANSSQVVKTDPPGGEAVELKICAARGDALTNTGENDCADTNLAQAACPHADDIRLQDAQQQYGANSGDTVVIPSAADDCSSVPESVAETEKVPSSQNDTSLCGANSHLTCNSIFNIQLMFWPHSVTIDTALSDYNVSNLRMDSIKFSYHIIGPL